MARSMAHCMAQGMAQDMTHGIGTRHLHKYAAHAARLARDAACGLPSLLGGGGGGAGGLDLRGEGEALDEPG